MKKKLLTLALCFSLVLSLCPIITPAEVARAEEMELVEEGYYDTHVIPDKYNTGVEDSVELIEVHERIEINGVEINVHNNGYYYINYYANSNLPETTLIEGYSFNDFYFITTNAVNFTEAKTIVFKNCTFHGINHDINTLSNLSFVFENCIFMSCVAGSNMTFTNCKIIGGAGGGDGMNAYNNVTANNCYFYGFPQTNDNGTHTDGVQIFGVANRAVSNIHFDNVRFEMPTLSTSNLINAPIMLSLDYNDGSDISFRNCIVNGGGYSIYAADKGNTLENAIFDNIQVGAGRKYGMIYPTISSGASFNNVTETEKLYVSSVWKDDTGRVHVVTTNDTITDRTLVIVTDNGVEEHIIECKATAEANGATTTEEIPVDVEIILEDADYVVCYDTEETAENQIRFVNWSGAPVYRSASPSQGGNSVNSNDGSFAEESTSINMTMITTEVNVIVPLNISCVINPNEVVDFTHGDLVVTNNSYVPVKMSLSMFDVVDGTKTMLRPNDIATVEEGLAWNCLNEEQSNTYISVGLIAEEENGWKSILANDYAYAGLVDDKFPLGIVGAKDSANLTLKSHHGNSFKEATELKLQIGFVAELYLE